MADGKLFGGERARPGRKRRDDDECSKLGHYRGRHRSTASPIRPHVRPRGRLTAAHARRNITAMSNAKTSSHRDEPNRRHNPRLRELVDEMLASIRAAANVDLWTTEERDRYEADMARIMKTVRTHAVSGDARARLD